MFKPKYQAPTDKIIETLGETQWRPPRVRYGLVASPEWLGRNRGELDEIAGQIVDYYKPQLNGFVNGQRQNYKLGTTVQHYAKRTLPGLDMRFAGVLGQETLDLTAYPEAAPEGVIRPKQRLEVKPAPVLSVDFPFEYWPIPGSASYNNPPVEWEYDGTRINWYNPGIGDSWTEEPDFSWEGSSYNDADMLLTGTGIGTKIYEKAASGKKYFEVELVTLPRDTPGAILRANVADPMLGQYTKTPIYQDVEETGYTQMFPEQLNTWFTPAIGLATAEMKQDVENNYTERLLGLNDGVDQHRSIYVVAVSTVDGPYERNVFNQGYYWIDNTSEDVLAALGITLYPGQHNIWSSLHGITDKPYPSFPDPLNSTWSAGDKSGEGDEIHTVHLGGFNPAVVYFDGPLAGQMNIPPARGPDFVGAPGLPYILTDWVLGGGAQWQCHGVVDGLLYVDTQWYPDTSDWNNQPWPMVPPSPFHPDVYIRKRDHYLEYTLVGTFRYGDYAQNSNPITGQTGAFTAIPWNASEGHHAPVIKGNLGSIGQLRNPADIPNIVDDGSDYDAPVNVNTEDFSTYTGSGKDTGVDLGALEEGDKIMIAVDTEERKVWFGKNGTWYGPEGDDADPAEGTGWATVLDSKDTEEPEYYPAMSWRVGPTKMTMHLGASCSYQPPGDFEYWDADEITIETDLGQQPDPTPNNNDDES